MGADQTRVCKDNQENTTLKNVQSIDDYSPRGLSLQRKANVANNTGLPNNLKNGVEALSGYSLDDVRVHYNSSKPAAVQAYAYTQGTDIHIAPGQESCLPHEAWHVTQQMSGRVSPTTSIGGVPVNNNAELEHEADIMGVKAIQCKSLNGESSPKSTQLRAVSLSQNVSQLKLINSESKPFEYSSFSSIDGGFDSSVMVGTKMEAVLNKGEEDFNNGQEASKNKDQDGMMDDYRFRTGLIGNQLVKGHLLNARLGGSADNKNLFPITDGANSKHLFFVENHVKELVLNGRQVHYSVDASPCDGEWNTECREAKFECHYETVDAGPKKDKKVTIYSIINKSTKKDRGKAKDKNGRELGKAEGNYKTGLNDKLRKSSNQYNMCNAEIVQDFFGYIDECIGSIVEKLGYFLDVDDVEHALQKIVSKIDSLEELEFEIIESVYKKMGYDLYFSYLHKIKSKPNINDIINPKYFIQYFIYTYINLKCLKIPQAQERDDFISKLNVEDCIDDVLSAIKLDNMTGFIQEKLSSMKDVLDKISVVTDNIECIYDNFLSETSTSEKMSSGNGKDAYKILGKKITKKVIKKIIKVADIIVKMLLFSKSVADKISDSEELETLFENVIHLHFAPQIHTKRHRNPRSNTSTKNGNALYSTRRNNHLTTNRTQDSSTNSSYNAAYSSYNTAYSSYHTQEKVSSGSEY